MQTCILEIWYKALQGVYFYFFKQNFKKKYKLVLKEYQQKVLIAIIQTIVTFETYANMYCYNLLSNIEPTKHLFIHDQTDIVLLCNAFRVFFYQYVYCMLSLLPLRNGAHSMKKTVLTLNFSFLPTPDQVGKVCLAMNAPSSGTSPHPTQLQWNDQ